MPDRLESPGVPLPLDSPRTWGFFTGGTTADLTITGGTRAILLTTDGTIVCKDGNGTTQTIPAGTFALNVQHVICISYLDISSTAVLMYFV
jgi:hypothetical protein